MPTASPNCGEVSGVVFSRRLNRSICVIITASASSAAAVQFILALSNVALASTEPETLRHSYAETISISANALSPIDDPTAVLW